VLRDVEGLTISVVPDAMENFLSLHPGFGPFARFLDVMVAKIGPDIFLNQRSRIWNLGGDLAILLFNIQTLRLPESHLPNP